MRCTPRASPPGCPVSAKKKRAHVERRREVGAAVRASHRHRQVDGGQLLVDGTLELRSASQGQLASRLEPEGRPVGPAQRTRQQPGTPFRRAIQVGVEELLLVYGRGQRQGQLVVTDGEPSALRGE